MWIKGRGNLPMSVFQKLDDAQRRRGYEWALDDIELVGIQQWAARLTVTLASDAVEARSRSAPASGCALGDWHHVALAYDGSGKAAGLRLFVNGKPFATDVVRDTLTGPIATDAPLRVGSKALGTPFTGQLDDLRLYNRALTPAQIEQLAIHDTVRVIVSGVHGKRSKDEAEQVREYFLTYAAPETLRTSPRRAEGAQQAEGRARHSRFRPRW